METLTTFPAITITSISAERTLREYMVRQENTGNLSHAQQEMASNTLLSRRSNSFKFLDM